MTGIAAWTDEFAGVVERIGARFARSEARAHAAAYLRGLVNDHRDWLFRTLAAGW